MPRNGKWGIIDKTGKAVVPFQYDEAQNPYEDYVPVRKGSKWGFLDLNAAAPATPTAPAANTAYASTQTVQVDGKPVEFQMYALKDTNGNPKNYIKVRDVASVTTARST